VKTKRMVRSNPQALTTAQRLENIEMSLKTLESEMTDTKKQLNHLDQLVGDMKEPKHHTKQKRFSLFSRKKRRKSDELSTDKGSDLPKESSIASITELMQNPMVSSFLQNSRKDKTGKKTKQSQMDVATILKLVENPLVQSLFKKSSSQAGKGDKKKKTRASGGFDLSSTMKLIQDPAIQSLLKNF
jgi:hypothetical protein